MQKNIWGTRKHFVNWGRWKYYNKRVYCLSS